jgi:phage tail-like protein
MPATPVDAIVASRFSIVIDHAEVATFSELGGILSEMEPIDYYYQSTDPKIKTPQLAKLPGKYKAPTISLKRGSDNNLYMWTWHEELVSGAVGLDACRRTGGVYMKDSTGKTVAAYEFHNAWVSKMSLGGLKAGASEVLIEECTLTCEHLIRVNP